MSESHAKRSPDAVVPDPDAQRALIEEWVRIDSVNPALDPSRDGEGALARRVRAWGETRGLQTRWIEPVAGRPSVLLRAAGRARGVTSRPGRTLLLNAHLDTVGVTGMDRPFTPTVADGRLYGRGAMDMKASLAACLRTAAWAASRSDLSGDVLVAAVADEEHDSIGTRAVLDAVRSDRDDGSSADLALVTEPTDLELHVAHRGFALLEATFHGTASHTSRPADGVNAVAHLGRALVGVEAMDARLRRTAPHRYVGHGSWQAVLARGGEELFTTPARAEATFERRTVPGESAARDAAAEAEALLAELRQHDPTVRAELRATVVREAFEADLDGPAVRAVERAAGAELGRAPQRLGAPYWTDAALHEAAGIPTVLFGPVGGGIHRPDEWVDLDSVVRFERVLRRLVLDLCRA